MKKLKALAAENGQTLSYLVEAVLRLGLERMEAARDEPLPPIPTFSMGQAKVDIANRNELYRVMEEEES